MNFKPVVLYVEDEDGAREQLVKFLNNFIDNLYVAKDGLDGFELYQKYKPDIVITDIRLPNLDGINMVKKMKSIDKHQYIIFTTSHSNSEYLIEAIDMQVDGYILKPINVEKLKSKIDSIVNIIVQKHELHQYQQELKNRVELEIEKRRENEFLLFQQAKLAQMGEMLSMIAHQWRQPLCSISASAISLSMKQVLGTLDDEDVVHISQDIQKQTQVLSSIINDFMDFNRVEDNQDMSLYEAFQNAYKKIKSQFLALDIGFEVDIDKNLKVFHNIKNVEHILLNLFFNSKDEFELKNIQNRKISIYTKKDNNYIELYIEDNAGGIPKEIQTKVFNPYFTTKEEGRGTGIGLYISKRMLESVNGAKLDFFVKDDCCTIFVLRFKSIA